MLVSMLETSPLSSSLTFSFSYFSSQLKSSPPQRTTQKEAPLHSRAPVPSQHVAQVLLDCFSVHLGPTMAETMHVVFITVTITSSVLTSAWHTGSAQEIFVE